MSESTRFPDYRKVKCSASEIASISGHKTLKEVERYVKDADQERMARNAMARVLATPKNEAKYDEAAN
jgi:hypothetical protein